MPWTPKSGWVSAISAPASICLVHCCLLLFLQFIHPLLSLPAQTGFHSHPPLSRLLLTQLLLPFFTSENLSTSLHHPLTSNTNIFCNSMFWPLPSCSCTHTHYVTLTYKKTCLIKESIVIFIHQVEWREVIYSHKYLLFGNYLHQSSGSLPTLLLETTFRIIQEERDRLDWFCPRGKGSKERGKKTPPHTKESRQDQSPSPSYRNQARFKGLAVGTVSQRRTLYAKYHIICGKNVESDVAESSEVMCVDILCTTPRGRKYLYLKPSVSILFLQLHLLLDSEKLNYTCCI